MSDNSTDGTPTDPAAPGAYPPPSAYPPPAAQPTPPPYTGAPTFGSAQGAPPAYGSYGAAPAYGAPAYGGYPANKTNTLAIVSLISSIAGMVILPFIASIVGVITGHMALGQIKRSGEDGRGLALAGTIVGWVGVGLSVLGFIITILVLIPILATIPTTYS